jgi:hypothetical protein
MKSRYKDRNIRGSAGGINDVCGRLWNRRCVLIHGLVRFWDRCQGSGGKGGRGGDRFGHGCFRNLGLKVSPTILLEIESKVSTIEHLFLPPVREEKRE